VFRFLLFNPNNRWQITAIYGSRIILSMNISIPSTNVKFAEIVINAGLLRVF